MTTTNKETAKKEKKAAPPKALAPQAKAQPPAVAGAFNPAEWGAPKMTSKDIQIPKIFTMQPMSKLVTAGTAKFGEFIDSLTGNVIGDTQHPIEFIPFFLEKVFVVMEEKNKKFEFKTQIPITAANENTEFEQYGENNVPQKWYRSMNVYVLLPKEVEDGTAIPYLISFRSSSQRAGQKLATVMFMKNLKAGLTPASMVMTLSGEKKTNDKGTFIVLDVKETRASSEAEVREAFEWVKTVRSGAVKVDHSDLVEEATSSGPAKEVSNEY